MKKVLLTLLFLQCNLASAGEQANVAIEPETPMIGQSFDVSVRRSLCSTVSDSLVNIQGNEIKIFVSFSGNCQTDPPPPPFLQVESTINGLIEGDYNLEYYRLDPADDFPPLPADYPLFFVEGIQFQVQGNPEPTTVNTITNIGIMALILLMLGSSFVFGGRKFSGKF